MIQNLIDDKLAKKQQERATRERSGKFSPSSFGKCFRAQYWNRKNEPQTDLPDARTLRVFKAGELFHDFVQGLLPKHKCEVKVETEDICGYADIVTEEAVYDIKSQHSGAFWYMKKDGYDINKQKYPNILQVCCYAALLDKSEGRLVFISKDDLCIAEYTFPLYKWVDAVELEISNLKKFWEKGVPPPEPRAYFNQKSGVYKECQYCSWRTKCKEMK